MGATTHDCHTPLLLLQREQESASESFSPRWCNSAADR
jgi:hypothetical protein